MSEIKTVYNPDVDERYEGGLVNDQFHGKGTFFFANGNKYVGDWVNNKRQGYGVMYFADGDRYEGQWINDKMNGKGTYYFKSGGKREGIFKNDKFVGQQTTTSSLSVSNRTNSSGRISPNFFATGRTVTMRENSVNEQIVHVTASNVEGFERASILNSSVFDQDMIAVNALLRGSSKGSYESYSDSESECEDTVKKIRSFEVSRRRGSATSNSSSLNGFSTIDDKRLCAKIIAEKERARGR